VIKDGSGRLLLIKRGHEPGKGLWSIPGGRVETGESDADALIREVREETGLTVTQGRLIGSVRRHEFDIRDYAATVTGGTLLPGDDADDAVWAGPSELASLPLTAGLLDALRSWGVL
jgi:ADP-ribose pyrophosphatase YjhB (NUDIX family)